MAKKRKRMTITQLYNRTAKGLSFFGEVIAEKKRATRKQLKSLQKLWKQIRKAEKEKGVTDLPTIAQAAKLVEELTIIPQQEVKEPLPYAEDEAYNEIPEIDFASTVLDDFLDMLETAFAELAGKYAIEPRIWHTMSSQHAEILKLFNEIRTNIGDENLATQLEQSVEYEKLRVIANYQYKEVEEYLDSIISDLYGIVNKIREAQEPTTFIPEHAINLDNI